MAPPKLEVAAASTDEFPSSRGQVSGRAAPERLFSKMRGAATRQTRTAGGLLVSWSCTEFDQVTAQRASQGRGAKDTIRPNSSGSAIGSAWHQPPRYQVEGPAPLGQQASWLIQRPGRSYQQLPGHNGQHRIGLPDLHCRARSASGARARSRWSDTSGHLRQAGLVRQGRELEGRPSSIARLISPPLGKASLASKPCISCGSVVGVITGDRSGHSGQRITSAPDLICSSDIGAARSSLVE